jgi:sensor histidine kinase regulating citrate/malate metabolism
MRGGRRRLWGRLGLSTQILLLQLAIIVGTVSAGFAVSVHNARNRLDDQAGQKSLTIARTVRSQD